MLNLLKKFTAPLFFLLVAAYFIFLQWAPVFPDPDSFYHAKMAVLMGENGLIKSFPWIKFASFTQNFTDHHFLYHLFLVPFIKIFPPLLGVKIATTILAWFSIFVFYLFLKKYKIRFPLLCALILISVVPFIFRMNLAKTSSASLIILLAALMLIWQKRYLALAMLSFIYVWTYGGWSILLVMVACQILAELIIKNKNSFQYSKSILKNLDWKLILSAVGGCLAGLIFNPYFPHNLYFYWEQVVQIGLINYQNKIGVGQEWYPFDPAALLATSVVIFILAIFAFTAFFAKLQKINREKDTTLNQGAESIFQKIFCLFIFSGLLLIMTLRSQRFIEYFAPFFILASAFLLNFSLAENFSLKKFLKDNFGQKIWGKLLLALPISLLLVYLVAGIIKNQQDFSSRFAWNYLKNASFWLKNNTPSGSLIFHSIWSDSTIMFFHNDHNIYLAGLDPTFFFRYNPKLYEEWTWIKEARVGKSLAQRLKDDFGAQFILVKIDEKPLLEIIKKDKNFVLRYEDDEAKIFEVN